MIPQLSASTQFGGYDGPWAERIAQLKTVEDWQSFAKAVQTAGAQNVLDSKANLTGIPAIRMESLDGTLRATVAQEENLTLFKRLKTQGVKSSIFEFSTKTSHGGAIGGSFNAETGDIRGAVANYSRQLIKIKYLMERAEISVVGELQGIVGEEDAKAQENASATMRLLLSNEWALFNGNSLANPLEYDGIESVLNNVVGKSAFYDMDGSNDTGVLFGYVVDAAQKVTGPQGGWGGRITDLYLPPSVQADLDLYLEPQWRVPVEANGPSSIEFGAPVAGIKTSFGKPIKLNQNWFINHGENPYVAAPLAVKTDGAIPSDAPSAPTLTATPVSAASVTGAGQTSRFSGSRNGTYYYAAESLTAGGTSLTSAIVSAVVAVGGAVDLSVTPGAGVVPTGVILYRSVQTPTSAPTVADLREFKRIPVTDPNNPTAPTVYRDLNYDLPGAARIFALDLRPEAIDFPELLSLTTFPLYPTTKATRPWALLYFGSLRLGYPRRHRVIKNYVPKNAAWKPHG